MIRSGFVALLFSALAVTSPQGQLVAQDETRPVDGLRSHTPNLHALVGARVVVSPERTIESGTVLVGDGAILAVGTDVPIPAGARVWRFDGKTIYPGLIDSYTTVTVEDDSAAAAYWNSQVRPERRATAHLATNAELAAEFRSQGICCRLVVPGRGVIKGTSSLITTGDDPSRRAVLAENIALHLSLRADGSRSSYPASSMGAVALARQAFYDADWYRRAWAAYRADTRLPRPEYNTTLECLQGYVQADRMVVIEAADEQYLLRADRFAREFALRMVVLGSGREYRRLDAVAKTGRTLILPLAFPKPPGLSTPQAIREVSLTELMDWDIAPENPARLTSAGVKLAFCSKGLSSPKELLPAVRRAVKRGLNRHTALAAMTTVPAELFRLSGRLGTVESGKVANLIVADGDLWSDGVRVLETWVDGRRYEVAAPSSDALFGQWSLALSAGPVKSLELSITKSDGKSSGALAAAGGKASAKLTSLVVDERRITASLEAAPLGHKGTAQLIALAMSASGGEPALSGTLRWPDGTTAAFDGRRTSDKPAAEKSTSGSTEGKAAAGAAETAKASFPVNYPLGDHGLDSLPEEPPLVVLRNATIWTCGPQGVIEHGSLVFGRGKIVALGPSAAVPEGAEVIDAKGLHITPGIIDCHSHMATDGGVNEGSQAITSEVRIGDFIDANDVDIYRQLAGGVTVSHVLHGSANPIGGQNQAIKLRWGRLPEELKFAEMPPTLKLALGENVKQASRPEPTDRYPQTRMGVVEIIADAFQAAADYRQRWQAWRETGEGLPPRRDLELDALVEVLEHRRWVHCHAYRQDEVLGVLETLHGFGVDRVCLQHILEGYKVADAITRYRATASAFSDWWAYKVEAFDAIPQNGPIMIKAGVLVSFNSDSAELARHLNHEAAKAMKYGGISAEEALKLVTINPARQMRVDRYVGSLEPGKHADLAVWSGSPLSNLSRCEQTWVDGRKYFDRAEELELRQKQAAMHATLVQKALSTRTNP